MARLFWTILVAVFCMITIGVFTAAILTAHGGLSAKLTGAGFLLVVGLPLSFLAIIATWEEFK